MAAGAIIRPVIIDFHTHIFPPAVRDQRQDYLRRDPTFAEMYASPKAKIATAEDLLRSMDEAGVDISVALGFAWRDHDLCQRHNDYLLEAAARSGGRIVPFCTVNMADARAEGEIERCAAAGAGGIGELRPENQGWDLNGEEGDRLAALALRHNLILLFHVTEPVGHDYPGKQGLLLESFYRFAVRHPELKLVGAHLGGGLPFFRDFVGEMGKLGHDTFIDTAAWHMIYRSRSDVWQYVVQTFDSQRTLFGSDFPLVTQSSALKQIEMHTKSWSNAALPWVFGKHGARLLGLERDDWPK